MSSPISRSDDDNQPLDRAAARRARLGPSFSGDRALVEFNRQLSQTADLIPEPPLPLDAEDSGPESQWSMIRRFLSLVGIAAAIAWGIVLLPTLKKPATEPPQPAMRQTLNDAGRAHLADAAPMTVDSTPARNEFPAVVQPGAPGMVAIARPPAAPANAAVPAATIAKSMSETAGPLSPTASTTAVADTPAAAISLSAAQSNQVTTNPASPDTSPSVRSNPDLAALAMPTASASPTSPQPQLEPATPQRVSSVAAATTSTPAMPPVRNKTASVPSSVDIAMLLSRGENFLTSGDLSSAQLLFRRAAEAGSAEAAMNLASTYDPHYLAEHHVVGVIGDEEKARAWYQRAIALGSAEASRKLAELGAK